MMRVLWRMLVAEYSKTGCEWREQLGDEAFRICREKGTEPAFSGKYWDCKTAGIYLCNCCQQPLFDSTSKYDSGSGWPSFYQPISPEQLLEHRDSSHGMNRVEVQCRRCAAHLGHVFEDGPAPTGLRYCINSASMKLSADND